MLSFLRLWWAFLRRDFMNAASYRLAFISDFASILFYVIIFFFVGKIFTDLGATLLGRYGGGYFPFVIVGLALQSLVGAGMGGFMQVISGEQYLGTLEPILGRRGAGGAFKILSAAAAARYVYSSGRIVVYFVVAALVFGLPIQWQGMPIAVASALLAALAYFGLGMLAAAYTLAFKQGNPVSFIYGQLGALLAGVYFPLEVLPQWLRGASAAFPLTYALELSRNALLGKNLTAESVGRTFISLGILAAITLAAGGVAFVFGLRKARRDGSLSYY